MAETSELEFNTGGEPGLRWGLMRTDSRRDSGRSSGGTFWNITPREEQNGKISSAA